MRFLCETYRPYPREQLLRPSLEGHGSMCEKLSILPQRQETDAEEFERGTLAVYSERTVLIGCQLVAARRAAARAVLHPLEFLELASPLPPSPNRRRSGPFFKIYYWFLLYYP